MVRKKIKRLVGIVVANILWTVFLSWWYELKILGVYANEDLFECIGHLLLGLTTIFLVDLFLEYKKVMNRPFLFFWKGLKNIWILSLIYNIIKMILPFVSEYHFYSIGGVIISISYTIIYFKNQREKKIIKS